MNLRIIHLRKKILENPRHQWTINEMSKLVEVTPTHLQKVFKAATGISPMNFLRNLRLEKAKELLETEFLRVHQICRQVGITDQTHFTRDFKKKYGLTPTEYRQQHHEKVEAEDVSG
jgi:AraC-like DNA-binding protein